MSAELVDPFARQPLLTEDEYHEITQAFHSRTWEDPQRYQAAVAILLPIMGSIAVGGGSADWCAHEATQALRRVMQRVLRGEMDAEVEHHG